MTGPGADPGGTLLVFLNEVAGGRRLLEEVRQRVGAGLDEVVLAAPQNQPAAGQIVDRDEVREAALSRVEVTQAVLSELGVEAVGTIMDPDPLLAFDDAVRAFAPREVLLSCLSGSRYGPLRRDLVEWAHRRSEAPVTHVPVRVSDDATRWDVTHALVVATQTVDSPDLVALLKRRAAERAHRYTFIAPPSGEMSRERVCEALAGTLAELYREGIDATGQPMSPAPLAAVRNALEHYQIDEVLISTLAGEESTWLREGLIERVREVTDKPVEHVETGALADAGPRPAGAGATEGVAGGAR